MKRRLRAPKCEAGGCALPENAGRAFPRRELRGPKESWVPHVTRRTTCCAAQHCRTRFCAQVWDGPSCEKPGLAVPGTEQRKTSAHRIRCSGLGLAARSRSLGDGAARALGVIAAPVVRASAEAQLQPGCKRSAASPRQRAVPVRLSRGDEAQAARAGDGHCGHWRRSAGWPGSGVRTSS